MTKQKKKRNSIWGKTIVTKPGRLQFPAIAVPTQYEDNPPKYQAMLVVKPTDRLSELQAEVDMVGRKAFGPAWDTDKTFNRPIVAGEEILAKIKAKAADDGKELSEQAAELYTGTFRILARGSTDKEPPQCYVQIEGKPTRLPRRPGNEFDLKAIEDTFFAGSYCCLAVTPFSYNVGKSRGVGLVLKGVQFVKDGPRLGATDIEKLLETEFGDFEFDEVADAFADDFSSDAQEVSEVNA